MNTTPITLLDRLRQAPDDDAWQKLVDLYTPLLFFWARRAGESEHDAADLVQEVFMVLVQTLPGFRYDKDGQFRSWLRTVTLNKLRDRRRRSTRDPNLQALRDHDGTVPDAAELYWEAEYRKDLSRRALQLMQTDFAPSTWQACWLFVVEGRPAAEVAQALGITENAVYLAKGRVLRKLRQELTGLIE